ENAAAQGDLDLTAFGKTYVFQGQGRTATIIDAHQIDRVFELLPGVKVTFKNLTITGGKATDDGSPGANANAGMGGGVLNNGGTVVFDNVLVRDNEALGIDGVDGAAGISGTAGALAR